MIAKDFESEQTKKSSRSWRTTHEEAAQGGGDLGGAFLGEEVARRDGVAAHVVRPAAPQGQRPARGGVPGVERAAGAPQDQQRAADAAPGPAVLGVVIAVEAGGGPVLLADRVDVGRVAQRLGVGGAYLRAERLRRRTPAAEGGVDDRVRGAGQQAFGR